MIRTHNRTTTHTRHAESRSGLIERAAAHWCDVNHKMIAHDVNHRLISGTGLWCGQHRLQKLAHRPRTLSN